MFNKSKKILGSVLVLILLMVFAISVVAVDTVKIGAIYPLTGVSAALAEDVSNAVNLAVDIINGEYPDLAPLPLAATAGLPNLGGAKIEIIYGNSQAQPEFGRSEAERLITVNKVDALLGCINSGVTKTATQVSERFGVPFVTGISTAAELTERGFKYLFRTTVTDATWANNAITFLKELNEKKGANIKNIAFLYEDNEFGINMMRFMESELAERGQEFTVVANVKYPSGAPSLDDEVTTLKNTDPDFILCAMSSEVITFVKAAKKLNYNIKVGMVGDIALFQELVATVGDDADYLLGRDVFSIELAAKKPLLGKVNQMYRERYGEDLFQGNSREFVAVIVLADAINRAGTTDKEAVRQALAETNMPSDQIILGWPGVKFDEKGQNIYGSWIIRQMVKGVFSTVWPFDIASTEVVIPMPKWEER